MTKSPLVPLFQRGSFTEYCFNPSLQKHALSGVEGRGRGDFGNIAAAICNKLQIRHTIIVTSRVLKKDRNASRTSA
jgi:hypothetical protein